MTKFCNCSSKWITIGLDHRQVELNFCTQERYGFDIQCGRCYMNFWYDADYENMMFDLKNMNS